MDFKSTLKREADAMGIKTDDVALDKFMLYKELLQEYNKRFNLTANDSDSEILYKHFIDSLSLLLYIKKNTAKCIDIGTGAGFPLVPVKIIAGSLEITLVDAVGKKTGFLKHLVKQLELDKTECIHARAEDLSRNKKYREQYELAVSRALAPLNIILEYSVPFLRVGGVMLAMKGDNVLNEINVSQNAFSELKCGLENTYEFRIRYNGEEYKRNILEIVKYKAVSEKYPRKAGMVKKYPL